MRMPFDSSFYIASPYGGRVDPITREPGVWHGGVDLVCDDRNVRAVVGGSVLQSRMVDRSSGDRTWEWGNYVSIAGDDGYCIYYCHLDKRLVEKGQRVSAGQIIGIEGNTGRSTGVHLHFEVRDWAAQQRDPCAYLGIPNVSGFEWEPPEPEEVHWWDEAWAWAKENGITDGTSPEGTASRAMVVTMLKRYHDRFF